MKASLRKLVRWMHLWLGLIGGLFVCVMGFSGGLVGLRPQIATLLSPPAPPAANCAAGYEWNRDWNQAARDISAYAHSEINRVYGPYGSDTRFHFRMATDEPILFKHVIYDACSGRVLGAIDMGWMDWTVDLHHNLLLGRTGRRWGGAIGIALLLSGVSGLLLWLLAKPDLSTAFHIRRRLSRGTPREVHRAIGLAAVCFLLFEAATGMWLTFPQTMRRMLSVIGPVEENVRPARSPREPGSAAPERVSHAGLGDWIAAAHSAIPDGLVREIRLPEGNGPVQIRMWRPGDFRSLGNNVVFVSSSSAKVLAVDRYADRSGSNRFVQAMAALHYDEWGGLTVRILCSVAGLATPLLFITGSLIWWYSKRRGKSPAPRPAIEKAAALTS